MADKDIEIISDTNQNILGEMMDGNVCDNQCFDTNVRAYEVVLKHYLKQKNSTGFMRILRCVGPTFLSRSRLPSKVSLGRYFLGCAVESGDLDLVTQLVQRGSDVREFSKGQTVLHLAVGLGNIRMVERLVKVGADLHQLDVRGNSVLFTAIDSSIDNKVEVINWLINNGIDLTRRNHAGKEPIHVAATSSPDLVKVFVLAGCDATARDDVSGYTPLHCACTRYCPHAAVSLISLGAEVNAVSVNQETPLLILLKYVEGLHDFHSKSRLRLAKCLVQAGGHLGFLKDVKFVKKTWHRKCLTHFRNILQSMRQVSSLQHLSRLVIRRYFENRDLEGVKTLAMPVNLKQYILFRDARTVEFFNNVANSKFGDQDL